MSDMTDLEAQIPWRDRKGGQTGIAEYDTNCFIASLPPPPTDQDVFNHLVSRPECTAAQRSLPSHLREQMAFIRLKQAFFPTGTQLQQAKRIDLLIRAGYVARSPSAAAWQSGMTELATGGQEAMASGTEKRRAAVSNMAADSMAALGPSGIGKTTVLRRMLDGYEQVVRHEGGQIGVCTQIVWLRVEAAADGSTKQTILSMFSEIDRLLGTQYVQRYSKLPREALLVTAQQLCQRYAIGLIAVDEIQNLANSRGGTSDLMSFFTSLVNVVNVPILMIGTMQAVPMMMHCFRTARRGEGGGSIVYEPMPYDDEWKSFVRMLFKYQWTAELTELSDEIAYTLWDATQGIIDIAVKLFVLSQMRAIRMGVRGKPELISVGLVRKTAEDSLKLVRPMLDALRRKDWKALATFEDLGSLDTFMAAELQKAWPGAYCQPDLSEIASSIATRLEGPDGQIADAMMVSALTAKGLGPDQVAAMMEVLARLRGSPDPLGSSAVAQQAPAVKKADARRPRGVKQPVTDPSDVRTAGAYGDSVSWLKAAGLLDVA